MEGVEKKSRSDLVQRGLGNEKVILCIIHVRTQINKVYIDRDM